MCYVIYYIYSHMHYYYYLVVPSSIVSTGAVDCLESLSAGFGDETYQSWSVKSRLQHLRCVRFLNTAHSAPYSNSNCDMDFGVLSLLQTKPNFSAVKSHLVWAWAVLCLWHIMNKCWPFWSLHSAAWYTHQLCFIGHFSWWTWGRGGRYHG